MPHANFFFNISLGIVTTHICGYFSASFPDYFPGNNSLNIENIKMTPLKNFFLFLLTNWLTVSLILYWSVSIITSCPSQHHNTYSASYSILSDIFLPLPQNNCDILVKTPLSSGISRHFTVKPNKQITMQFYEFI